MQRLIPIVLLFICANVGASDFEQFLKHTGDSDFEEVIAPIPPVVEVVKEVIAPIPPVVEVVKDPITNLYIEETHPDEYCIALNIYYESRADNLAGKYAVADVVLNRVEDKRFPDTVCGVVRDAIMLESWSTAQFAELPEGITERKYYPKKNRCQFSWYCDGLADDPDQQAAWLDAQTIAYNIVQYDKFRGITEGATHYHATYVSPDWSLVYEIIGRIGEHIFYKW